MAFWGVGGIVLCGLCVIIGVTAQDPPITNRVTIPPLITTNPSKFLAFREYESIELTCEASGIPPPTYRWTYNGEDFDPSGAGGRVAIQPGVGTLIFAWPIEEDQAIYQCFAENNAGTALSVNVDLRHGILEPFAQTNATNVTPQLGMHQTLRCTPPRSFPAGRIFWATMDDSGLLNPVTLSSRVSIDYEGSLHFANVQSQDYMGGQVYACVIENTIMRKIEKGALQRVVPQGQTPVINPPLMMWQSPQKHQILMGEQWRVKCIVGGNPTPRVTWSRQGMPMPPRKREESFGQELVIDDVQFEDEGKYECQGINSNTNEPIRRSYDLEVQAAPYWTAIPESFDATENETAEFHCEAGGVPDATCQWYINGVKIESLPSNPRWVVEPNKLTFLSVIKEDALVTQCNCSNKHGYIYENAYLNVLAEAPIILEEPEIGKRAAESQTVTLICDVFGSPRPLVVWTKGNEQLTGGRFVVLPEGHLEITDVSLVDAGYYTCTATNRFGNASATGSLVVRRATQIQMPPLDVMVYEGTEAKFTCTATTDAEEVDNLQIYWKMNGEPILYEYAQRMFQNDMDNSLTISGTISLDTATYSCVATNGLDEDERSAQLVVQGPPDPPNNVEVKCEDSARKANITWRPGKENYAPILNFIIQFNTTFDQDTWIDIASNVSQNERRMIVTMSPYGNYTFRVLARNKIGMSAPSMHTRTVCTTLEDRPFTNPENVMGEGDQPLNLVIYWTPMPKIEQNGPDFQYLLSWWRDDEEKPDNPPQESVNQDYVYSYEVPGTVETYKPYRIEVRAKNSVGPSTGLVQSVLGWSGENTPLVRPEDVTVDESSIGGNEVTLVWTHVNTEPDAVRGYFRGYRIEYRKTDDPDDEYIREHDFIINETTSYPRPREKRSIDTYETIEYVLTNVPAFSNIELWVRVLNKYYAGEASDSVYFTTTQSTPGAPATFNVIGKGSTFFELLWTPPMEPNGHLRGYNISYQTIVGLNLGRMQFREAITDPEINRVKLTGLSPQMMYRVYLYAVTDPGMGEPIFLDAMTIPAGFPNPPTFDILAVSDTWVHVKWEPSRSGNPGSVFYVEWRARGQFQWEAGADVNLHYSANVSDLNPGYSYQIRVVAKNGEGYESPSGWQEFTTGGVGPGRIFLASAGWFYGIFASLAIVFLIMALFIWLKKSRDVWWEEKEALLDEQVRQLQAEEAARQMGLENMEVKSGSLENLNISGSDDGGSASGSGHSGGSGGSVFKGSLSGDEEEEEDDDEEEEEETDEDEEDEEDGYVDRDSPRTAALPGTYYGQGFHPGYQAQGYSQPTYNLQDPQQGRPGASFI